MKNAFAASLLSLLCVIGCSHAPANPEPSASSPAAATPTTQPVAGVSKQTFVLVHGAYAGGWEWKKVGDLLTEHGHIAYRPTYSGQGEREHLANPEYDLNTYITDVVNIIRFEDLHDIVLVGHSFGGMVVTGVADRIPERIKTLIYVDAALPIDGETRSNAGGGNIRPQTSPNGFTGSAPRPGQQAPYTVPMPAKAFSTPISLKNQEKALKIPTHYIMTVDFGRNPEQDMYFPFYTRAKNRGNAVSVMPGDHLVHINQTNNLVDRLERATLDAKPANP